MFNRCFFFITKCFLVHFCLIRYFETLFLCFTKTSLWRQWATKEEKASPNFWSISEWLTSSVVYIYPTKDISSQAETSPLIKIDLSSSRHYFAKRTFCVTNPGTRPFSLCHLLQSKIKQNKIYKKDLKTPGFFSHRWLVFLKQSLNCKS